MSNFVVDASVVCCWVLPDEASTIADRALDLLGTNDAVAPDLVWPEVRNVLMLARRRKRIDFDLVAHGLHFQIGRTSCRKEGLSTGKSWGTRKTKKKKIKN